MVRDGKGRFVPGSSMDDEMKSAISKGQIRRHRQNRLQQDQLSVTTKRCTQCKKDKRVPDDYVMRKRTLACGEVRTYPSGECKECASVRREKWKANYIAEHGREVWLAQQREWNNRRKKVTRRRYQREYGRMLRLEQGATPRGPWMKYRGESEVLLNPHARISVAPFRQWWASLSDREKHDLYKDDRPFQRAVAYALEPNRINTTKKFLYRVAEKMDDSSLVTYLSMGAW